jgi:ribosomal protein S18 acetylase RimI-like enzyme
LSEKCHPPSQLAFISLAVAAAHRREGIATALIPELKQIAVARAAYVIIVVVNCHRVLSM